VFVLTSNQSADIGAIYWVLSDAWTYTVRIGYDGEQPGKQRPPDAQVLPFLRLLATSE
jgi:hypothetical protein